MPTGPGNGDLPHFGKTVGLARRARGARLADRHALGVAPRLYRHRGADQGCSNNPPSQT